MKMFLKREQSAWIWENGTDLVVYFVYNKEKDVSETDHKRDKKNWLNIGSEIDDKCKDQEEIKFTKQTKRIKSAYIHYAMDYFI